MYRMETDATRNDSKNLREPTAQNKEAPTAGNPRSAGAVYLKVATGERLSSTVGQKVPSRPLSEEQDEEVAVHELQREACGSRCTRGKRLSHLTIHGGLVGSV